MASDFGKDSNEDHWFERSTHHHHGRDYRQVLWRRSGNSRPVFLGQIRCHRHPARSAGLYGLPDRAPSCQRQPGHEGPRPQDDRGDV